MRRKSLTSVWRRSMSLTRKTPEHLKSAKNLRGVAEAAAAEVAEAVGAAVASEAVAAEVVAWVAGVAAAEVVARSERQAVRGRHCQTTGWRSKVASSASRSAI